jgi:chromosome segregation ATPase
MLDMENINVIIKKIQNIVHYYLYKDNTNIENTLENETIDIQLESILPLIYQIKHDYNLLNNTSETNNKKISDLENNFNDIIKELDEKAIYIKKLNNKISTCELAEQDAKLELQYEEKENDNLYLEINKLKEEIELLKNEKFNKTMFINELKDHINDRDNIITKLNNHNKEKDNEIKNLREILTEKTEKINSLNNIKMDLITLNNKNTNNGYFRTSCIIS